MKIRYVGLKDEERAFTEKTGIVWTPGLEAEIDVATASRMLQHPDVFEDASKPAKTPVALASGSTEVTTTTTAVQTAIAETDYTIDAVALAAFDGSGLDVEAWNALTREERKAQVEAELARQSEEHNATLTKIVVKGEEIVLDGKTKAELQALCTELGVTFSKSAGAPTLTAKLVEAFPAA